MSTALLEQIVLEVISSNSPVTDIVLVADTSTQINLSSVGSNSKILFGGLNTQVSILSSNALSLIYRLQSTGCLKIDSLTTGIVAQTPGTPWSDSRFRAFVPTEKYANGNGFQIQVPF